MSTSGESTIEFHKSKNIEDDIDSFHNEDTSMC